jgi:hypothetical protein
MSRWWRISLIAALSALSSGESTAQVMAQGVGEVDPRLCQALTTRHRPAPDVEYIPGVDVRGRAVAPADLPGSAGANRQTLERFEIPVTLDFAQRMGFSGGRVGTSGKLPGNAEVGRLIIDGGRVTFNGAQVGGGSEAALAAACGRYR